jgi:lipopolysaccharide cholinephosphotransferase
MKNVRLSQMSKEDRKVFHSKLVGILQKIMEVCEENNIHWFVGYGACIGAIRHKGCIPWDDDIDVCMPRPDYDRFIEICKKTDLGNYEIATPNDTPGYYVHIVHMYDKNTTLYFTTRYLHVGGIFIDIFPIDGASDGNIKSNYRRCRFWKKISSLSRYYYTKSDLWHLIKEGKICRCSLIPFTSLFRNPLQKLSLRMVEKTTRKYPYECSEYCTSYETEVYGMKNIIPQKWIEETVWVPFEDIQVRVPKYYHEYLTHIYGDYMTPPPDDKKDDRHVVKYLDFEKRLTREEILALLSE